LKEVKSLGQKSFADFFDISRKQQPIQRRNGKLEAGIIFTNDPLTAENHISFILVGKKACQAFGFLAKD